MMSPHSETPEEKTQAEAAEALATFFGQFGTMDVYAQIVLEEFLEALLGK
jgi:hypothetical protein